MKKILFIFFLLLAGCNLYEDYTYDEFPDERIKALLDNYENMLVSAPYGWFFYLSTEYSGGYSQWMTFGSNNRVTMLSDIDYTWTRGSTSETPKESSWRLKSEILPSLIFDTYNYLHILSNPHSGNYGAQPGSSGETGEGHTTDYEFYIRGIENGALVLEGKYNGSKAIMVPANEAEALAAMNGGLKTKHEITDAVNKSVDFPMTEIDGTEVFLDLTNTRSIEVVYKKKNKWVSVKRGTYLDMGALAGETESSSIYLFDPVTIGSVNINGVGWDGDQHYVITDGKNVDVHYDVMSPYTPDYSVGGRYEYLEFYTPLPGSHDQDFMDQIVTPCTEAAGRVLSNFRNMRYLRMQMFEDPADEEVKLRLYFQWYNTSGTGMTSSWAYRFKENKDGTITIYDRDQYIQSSNISKIEMAVKPLLDYFCYVPYSVESSSTLYDTWVKDEANIEAKTFSFGGVKNKTPGSAETLGAFIPIDGGYSCIGILTN